ncbi:MAG: glycosyltransferase family 4 protein [Armatimonadota bacterium]
MTVSQAPEAGECPGSVCFIHTSPAMLHLLTGDGPDAMGGAELQMYLLGREMRRRGWSVSYLVGDYGQGNSICTDEGLQVEVAYEAGQQGALSGTTRALCRFWQALASVDADVYVTRGLTAQTGVVAAFARSRRRHSIFWFGKNAYAIYAVPRLSDLPFHERGPAWYGMRNASAVVCQTEHQLDLLREHVGREGVLIRNVTPWHDADRSRGAGGPVLWVGSIQPKKRPEILLEVAAAMPDVEFIIAGGRMRGHESLHERVVCRAAQLPNVRFPGFVPHDEIREYFDAADLLVSTSDGSQEGFPNVFLQAWSVGMPVVATCDPDDIIEANRLGRVCESTSELIRAIRAFKGRPDLRETCATRARAYVAEHHSPERVGRHLNCLLTQLVAIDAPARALTERVGL